MRTDKTPKYKLYLGVAHEQHNADALDAGFHVEASQVHLEVGDAVALAQRDLEHLRGTDEGRQSRQTLLAAAADADEQRVAARRLQDAVDAQYVRDRVLEQ